MAQVYAYKRWHPHIATIQVWREVGFVLGLFLLDDLDNELAAAGTKWGDTINLKVNSNEFIAGVKVHRRVVKHWRTGEDFGLCIADLRFLMVRKTWEEAC